MNKELKKREEIREHIESICKKYYNDNPNDVKEDKQGNKSISRGYIKNMFEKAYEGYVSEIIAPPYTGVDLWHICCCGEIMVSLCNKYNAIPNKAMLSCLTGINIYILNKIEKNTEADIINRLDEEYGRDYKNYFNQIYNDSDKDINERVKIQNNIEEAYPVYCLLQQLREIEKDERIERGRLGDITTLNAPIELGGFGFAHPQITVDNRKLIINDESSLLNTYAFAKQQNKKVMVEKEQLKNEAVDLFKEVRCEGENRT